MSTQVLTNPQRAKLDGYPSQTYHVTTEDGYILELHRIPFGRRETNPTEQRPVILLMHCMMCSSDDWLQNTPDRALGYILADSGYDVWFANARGNRYSRNHVVLDPELEPFWRFSWHEIGLFDLSASIDLALSVSGADQLSYLGFSTGAAILLALLSERPSYNEKIKVAALLAPAAFRTNARSTLFQLSPAANLIDKIAPLFGLYELDIQGKVFNTVATTLCSPRNPKLNPICFMVFSFFLDLEPDFANQEFLPFILSTNPSGGSLRTLTHSLQVKEADRFQQYDYGEIGNNRLYGMSEPPEYNLQNVIIPVGLFSGMDDDYVPIADADRLARALPNVVLRFIVNDPRFSHFDFLWANTARELIYNDLILFLQQYD